MSDKTYNGWKNRQTWAAWLELTNDYDLYQLMQSYCKLCIKLDKQPSYKEFVNVVGCGEDKTSSGTRFISGQLSYKELDGALAIEIEEIKRFQEN